MTVMSGCHEARNAIIIAEVLCPKCGKIIELFVKDGSICADSVCEDCGYQIEQSTPLGKLTISETDS